MINTVDWIVWVMSGGSHAWKCSGFVTCNAKAKQRNRSVRRCVPISVYSKAYSTATQQASLAFASWPCCRRLWRVIKDVSHAGHECMPSDRTLASPCEACERDLLDDRDNYASNRVRKIWVVKLKSDLRSRRQPQCWSCVLVLMVTKPLFKLRRAERAD